MVKSLQFIPLTLLLIAISQLSCESLCGLEIGDPVFTCIERQEAVLVVADFESGKSPNQYGGMLGAWNDPSSKIKVSVTIDSAGGGADRSLYYAKLTITGNDGTGTDNWSGGGLFLEFTNCDPKLDISGYQFLEFEARATGQLKDTKVKLESRNISNGRERIMSNRRYGRFPDENWITVSIPLIDFDTAGYIGPANVYAPIDFTEVVKMVTISVNDGSSPLPVDGELLLDNIRFTK